MLRARGTKIILFHLSPSCSLLQELLCGRMHSGDCELLERGSSCDKSVRVAECAERVGVIWA